MSSPIYSKQPGALFQSTWGSPWSYCCVSLPVDCPCFVGQMLLLHGPSTCRFVNWSWKTQEALQGFFCPKSKRSWPKMAFMIGNICFFLSMHQTITCTEKSESSVLTTLAPTSRFFPILRPLPAVWLLGNWKGAWQKYIWEILRNGLGTSWMWL